MNLSTRGWMSLRAALLATIGLLSSCSWTSKLRQEHRQSALHREQQEEAVGRNSESKADAAARKQQLDHDTRLRQLQTELIVRGDPDSLAASALFARELANETNATSLQLATRAVTAAPDRTDLLMVLLQLCENASGCNALAIEQRLRQLDPDNGVTWVYALQRAELANNGAAWRAARDGLANSQRITLYWNRTVSHLAGAAAGKAGFDSVAAVIEVTGIEATLLESLPLVSRVCPAQTALQPEVVAQCRKISAAFRNSDRTLLEAYGTTLAMGLWPADSVEGRQIAAERRGLRYRADLMAREKVKFSSAQSSAMLAAAIARYPTEQGAFRALTGSLGLSADPPASWQEH